jgi:solute carrier family 7 (L-type amino acid transporter), member 5
MCNVAYFAVLSRSDIIASDAVAIEFSNDLGGGMALKVIIALGVAFSTLGSCNGSILTGGRLFFAVSRTNQEAPALLPAFFNKLNSRGAPVPALLAQCVWGIVLLLLPGSSFSSLLDYFGPVSAPPPSLFVLYMSLFHMWCVCVCVFVIT